MSVELIAWALGGALVLFLLGAGVVLATPVRIEADFRTGETGTAATTYHVRVGLFGGAVTAFRAEGPKPVDQAPEKKKQEAPEAAKSERPSASANRRKKRDRKSAFSVRRALMASPQLVADLLACIKFERLDADITFGLADPAETGALYGALTPLVLLASDRAVGGLRLTPDFAGPQFSAAGRLAARATPVALLAPILVFIWRIFAAPHMPALAR